MSARQLIVLIVAAIAAIGALLLIRSMGGQSAEPTAQAGEAIAGEQVLVAARDIQQGAALAPSDLAVRLFPTESVSPSFVRLTQQPSAQADMVGSVTRRAFAAGEPITTGSVIQPEGRGFMAAQLQPGFRAVAVEITPGSAAGNYIQPNDHVDIIVTQRVQSRDGGGGEQTRSDIVLEDIRVLALGQATQPQTSGEEPAQAEANVAVLEMTAEDARVFAQAEEMGEIRLALRGVEVETVGMRASQSRGLTQQSGGVLVHAFGTVSGGGR
jgi:pilus assembly protein CpaB